MWFCLRVLWDEDGISQRELSQRVRMMEPTTVTALKSMERRGIVRRALEKALLPRAAAVNAIASKGVTSEEMCALRAILTKIRANLDGDPRI